MTAPAALVLAFHERYGVAVREHPTLDVPASELVPGLIAEEAGEFEDALAAGDLVGMADALADLVYVCYGRALTLGIPLDDVIAEVHRSNMTKERDPAWGNGPAGKLIKGHGYERPDVAAVLGGRL